MMRNRRVLLLVFIVHRMLQASLAEAHSLGVGGESWWKPPLWRREAQQRPQQLSRRYKLLPAEEIRNQLLQWSNQYPDLVRVTTSQDKYGLPRAGRATDCPFDEGDGCKNYILTIQDFVAHPVGSASSQMLPEVLWSGALHGNERVGPTAVVEAAALLLEAAACEAKPNMSKKGGNDDAHVGHFSVNENDTWEHELASAKDCRKSLSRKGVNDVHRQWLARLVSTRRIVVVPTANALGYFRNRREEGTIDPNRDFPFDLEDSTKCMRTIAGRTFNEIFQEHMFQLSLTFHGGMEVVAYEWGAPSYLDHLSPDDEAQAQIAHAYSDYGGGFATSHPYNTGTMNDLVYYVRGGMEDWAYAGSWDPERVAPCTPTTYGGYDQSKTKYNNSTLRVFNMLIETSNQKEPPASVLGTSLGVLDADTSGNGHVSRNIRLALLAADMVEPYVTIVGANDLALTDDIVPLSLRGDRVCESTKTVMIPRNIDEVVIEWTVGGAFQIDDTSVWYGKWEDMPVYEMDCLSQPSTKEVQSVFKKGMPVGLFNGTGRFSESGSIPKPSNSITRSSSTAPLGPVFSARIDVSQYQPRQQVAVVAMARADQSWRHQPNNIGPIIPPQSHVVNARTNPSWRHESAGKIVQGRLDWYSIPLTLVIGDYTDSVGTQSGRQVGTIELSNRFGQTTGTSRGGTTPKKATKRDAWTWKQLAGLGVALAVFMVTCILCLRRREGVKHQRIMNELFEEEGQFTGNKPYSDFVDDSLDEFELDEHGQEQGDLELQEYQIQ